VLVFHLDVFDWMEPMPESESTGDDKSGEQTDEKEQSICGQRDEKEGNYGNRSDKSGRALQAKTKTGPGHIGIILTLTGSVGIDSGGET
jgi:hypothetical protein